MVRALISLLGLARRPVAGQSPPAGGPPPPIVPDATWRWFDVALRVATWRPPEGVGVAFAVDLRDGSVLVHLTNGRGTGAAVQFRREVPVEDLHTDLDSAAVLFMRHRDFVPAGDAADRAVAGQIAKFEAWAEGYEARRGSSAS